MKNISDYENICSVNPLYVINKADGYIKGSNESRYLIFASTEKNKEVLVNQKELRNGIKYLIKTINGGKAGEYQKDFMKTNFSSDDNLLLNEIMKLYGLAIVVRSIFEEDGKYYSQVFLDEFLYEL